MANNTTRFVAKNGIDNNGNTLINLSDPVNLTDAVTKQFSANASNLTSGTISASLITDTTVTGKLLTGYAVGTNTVLAATDTILGAFGKVQGQINAMTSGTGMVTSFNTRTGAVTLTSSDITTALGYTPINKTGDTGIGNLSMGALTATTGTFSSQIQALGLDSSWGVTSGVATGAFNAVMGTGSAATWLLSGTSGGTFRAGIQVLDAGGGIRFYEGSNYFSFSGNAITASNITASQATFSGNVSLTSITGLSAWPGGPGSIGFAATPGLAIQARTGAGNDFTLINPSGSTYIISVPTGTSNVVFAGAGTFNGPVIAKTTNNTSSGDFYFSDSATGGLFTSNAAMNLYNNSATNNNIVTIGFYDSAGSVVAQLGSTITDHVNHSGNLVFGTRLAGTYGTRFIINTDGSASFYSNSVSMGALSATTGTFSGAISVYGNQIPALSTGYLYWNGSAFSWNSSSVNWAVPGAIGSTTPNTGAFTTLSATSFSGAGTGLTGTAASLSIGGNAATATNLIPQTITFGLADFGFQANAVYVSGNYTVGAKFASSIALTCSAIRICVAYAGTYRVGIFNSSGTLLAQSNDTAVTPYIITISLQSSVSISAYTQYYIGVYETSGTYYTHCANWPLGAYSGNEAFPVSISPYILCTPKYYIAGWGAPTTLDIGTQFFPIHPIFS